MRTLFRRRAFTFLVAVAAAWPQAGQAVNAQAEKTAADLDAEWTAVAAGLVRRCEAGGHDRLAALIGGWQLPDEGDRQFILSIPAAAAAAPPDWIDTPAEASIWEDFLAVRRTRASGTFALAVATSRTSDAPAREVAGDERPALEQGTAAAIRLLYRVLRDDPDHERAREAGGWVKRQGAWVWPEVARRLDKGEEHSAEFGWLPRGRQQRYREGDRYEQGRWTKAGADGQTAPPRKPLDLDRHGRMFASDHWQITTTAHEEAAANLAQRLEETHVAWLQVFGAFQYEPPEWEQRFEGRGRPRPLDPFLAKLAVSRQEYVAALEPLEPAIARTLGIYWTPTRTAWFFEGEGQEPTTVHHEAVHQLFAEKRRTSPLAGERCGFWAIEAVACYMESLEPQPWGWTVGGRDAGRAARARERLIEDGFHVPLAELTALGRRDFQADDRLPQIYSEISGLADFFMNGRGARYREAFLEYLARIYTGTVDADTLSRLCRRSYVELDDEYRHHMAR
ncbi:MAG: hypothetical protein ACKO6B_06555 [Planctomycetia bacterium]